MIYKNIGLPQTPDHPGDKKCLDDWNISGEENLEEDHLGKLSESDRWTKCFDSIECRQIDLVKFTEISVVLWKTRLKGFSP